LKTGLGDLGAQSVFQAQVGVSKKERVLIFVATFPYRWGKE